MSAAIRQGFRGVDTACQPKHYDEAAVGAGVAACLDTGLLRSDLYLQTKFTPLNGHDPEQIHYDRGAPLDEQVAQSLSASLRNLRTDYLDALVLHSPLPTSEQLLTVWGAMEAAVDGGSALLLGISNCYSVDVLTALYRSARVKPSIVQNRFHSESGYDREIRALCRRFGIVYQSFWTLTANQSLLNADVVRTCAARHSRTTAQILFRYLTQIGVVPLTGTTSMRHMRDDLAIFEFELTSNECTALQVSLETMTASS